MTTPVTFIGEYFSPGYIKGRSYGPTCQRNISQRCWCVCPPCYDVLVMLAQVWKRWNFHATVVYVASCCARLARFVQRFARACALVRFATPSVSQRVATGWPNACNLLRPAIFRYVAMQCRDRLAKAFEVGSSWKTMLYFAFLFID